MTAAEKEQASQLDQQQTDLANMVKGWVAGLNVEGMYQDLASRNLDKLGLSILIEGKIFNFKFGTPEYSQGAELEITIKSIE